MKKKSKKKIFRVRLPNDYLIKDSFKLDTPNNSICQRLAIAVDRIEAQLLRLENF